MKPSPIILVTPNDSLKNKYHCNIIDNAITGLNISITYDTSDELTRYNNIRVGIVVTPPIINKL